MLDWLALRAQASPEHTALIFEDQVWNYAALNDATAAMSAQLYAAGVAPGMRVAVLMPNRAEYVVLIHALARVGALMVPLNLRLTTDELRARIEQAGCDFLIPADDEASLIDSAWTTLTLDELAALPADDAYAWMSAELDLDRVQSLIFTSGTTGQPKGALLTFGNHYHSAMASAYRLGTLPDDRWLACMPLYHVGGQAIVLRSCLYGITLVLHQGFDVQAVSTALDDDAITLVSLVPTMLHRLLDHREDRAFPPALRCVLIGGAAANEELITRSLDLGLPIALTYGLTEAASQVATATPEQVRRKPGSVRKPLFGARVRIISSEGDELPPGEIGEIVVSGPTIMQGYDGKPPADGEIHSGDLGHLDEDGDLWVVQRRTDLIVSGGENVYPAEIEAVLLRHPNITEACVVGLADPEWGQRVSAAIVADSPISEEEVIAYCREHLAGYKVPRIVSLVSSLPATSTGKVKRDKVLAAIKEMRQAEVSRQFPVASCDAARHG